MEIVSALIIKNKRVLLIQDDLMQWGTPGGIANFHESHHDALRRELQQQLGIAPSVIAQRVSDGKELPGYYFLLYRTIVLDLPKSNKGFGWFTAPELSGLNANLGLRACMTFIRKVLNETP